ncbi:glycosyltransferase [Aeromicrobium sp. CF3.5]|uniref:glycosyltransferase n=1 Tax=Aeromicrobium sp. CF3.5 TaxID=3373078 RepID=UPI003EE7E874
MTRPEVRVICVVVPAHDEQRLLPEALRALDVACAVAGTVVELTVVANGCHDLTAEVARDLGVHVIEVDVANVGAARAAGFDHALARHSGHLSEVWFATTDADSRVPAGWFGAHRAAAASGADAHLGTIALTECDRRDASVWADAYDLRARQDAVHGHVHGANLGISALAYHLVGGFRPLAVGEDADLVGRLAACGAVVSWSADLPVTTSARRTGRAPDGVAADIARSAGLATSPVR